MSSARRDRVRLHLRLFAPTGPYAIGTVQLHLVDHSRRDPWTRRPRELMVSVWYPAAMSAVIRWLRGCRKRQAPCSSTS